jgi:hypothetical protein
MATYRDAAPTGLDFGDVCAGAFLADIRVDSRTVRVYKFPDSDKALNFTAYVEATRPSSTGLVVTAGYLVERAIVVSDSCAVETALGRGDSKARGRIWFAPLRKLTSAGALKEVEDSQSSYGRVLLRSDDDSQEHWVAELQYAFPADASSVRAAIEANRTEFVLCGLDSPLDQLRAKWAAFSTRSGPLVAQENASRLVDHLTAHKVPDADAEGAADALVEVAAASWVFEGGSLEAAAALREPMSPVVLDAVDALHADLATLGKRVVAACDAVALVQRRLSESPDPTLQAAD